MDQWRSNCSESFSLDRYWSIDCSSLLGFLEVIFCGVRNCHLTISKRALFCKFFKVKSKVPEGHHPRGTTLREALRGNLPLRGLCGCLSEGPAGLCGVLRGSAGFSEVFRG